MDLMFICKPDVFVKRTQVNTLHPGVAVNIIIRDARARVREHTHARTTPTHTHTHTYTHTHGAVHYNVIDD